MTILDLFFPKKCLECGEMGRYICPTCLKNVPPSGWGSKEIYSCFKYEGVIRKAIIALKYKYSLEIAKELSRCLVDLLLKKNILVSSDYCLVPIPMHWYRKNFRGFNQSEEVGKLVAKKMNWDFVPNLLIRTKSTVPQAQLTGLARRENLHGVFSINPDILFSEYSNIILFDDVLTTGSTLLEASKVLRSGGAGRILCLTIAK